ncbi:MAG: hypothetical protein IPJ71_19465 [Bdellovibrionales bacterium]|nr:hypothetical protein [Bdellovibrionales bacterium]
MKLAFEILKPQILKILLFLALTSWACFATFQAVKNQGKTLLIGIDANGTRIITSQDDPLFKTELTSFLKHYFSKAYNFTPLDFSQNVGEATNLMSESLWKSEGENIQRLKTAVEKSGLVQNSRLRGLSQVDKENFQALLQIEQKSRLQTESFQVKVILKLQRIERSDINPWGMEIIELREEKL